MYFFEKLLKKEAFIGINLVTNQKRIQFYNVIYCNDYNYIMMFYGEALKEPDFPSHRELYNALKKYFLEGWKAAMVLQWVKEGRFDKAESMDLKKMYMDLALID